MKTVRVVWAAGDFENRSNVGHDLEDAVKKFVWSTRDSIREAIYTIIFGLGINRRWS